jgi:aminopeptidase N
LGGNKRRLKLKQSRYLADGSTDDQLWQIPLTFVKSSSGGKPFHKFLLTQREQVIELDGIGDDEWVKVISIRLY